MSLCNELKVLLEEFSKNLSSLLQSLKVDVRKVNDSIATNSRPNEESASVRKKMELETKIRREISVMREMLENTLDSLVEEHIFHLKNYNLDNDEYKIFVYKVNEHQESEVTLFLAGLYKVIKRDVLEHGDLVRQFILKIQTRFYSNLGEQLLEIDKSKSSIRNIKTQLLSKTNKWLLHANSYLTELLLFYETLIRTDTEFDINTSSDPIIEEGQIDFPFLDTDVVPTLAAYYEVILKTQQKAIYLGCCRNLRLLTVYGLMSDKSDELQTTIRRGADLHIKYVLHASFLEAAREKLCKMLEYYQLNSCFPCYNSQY